MTTNQPTVPTSVTDFFDRYAAALLDRDEAAVARLYAVPSLVLFPRSPVAVSSQEQTAAFFASSWDQYEGVTTAERQVHVMGTAPGSVWADVVWTYGGRAQERFCYQLVDTEQGWQVAVLTPMELVAG